MNLIRPYPPESLLDEDRPLFLPAPDVEAWLRSAFIEEGYETFNPDHAHLNMASIGVLWTNAPCTQKMRDIIGQAELVRPPMGGPWARGRWLQQMQEWFIELPDFLITLSAPYAAEADDGSFMALVEHELRHCTVIRFTRQGMPIFGMRGHDVEVFIGDVERYGMDATATRKLVEAALNAPLISAEAIQAVCGTCAA